MKYFLILFVIVLILMIVIKAISNGVDKTAEKIKNDRDRAAGAYKQTENQNLADRFKK